MHIIWCQNDSAVSLSYLGNLTSCRNLITISFSTTTNGIIDFLGCVTFKTLFSLFDTAKLTSVSWNSCCCSLIAYASAVGVDSLSGPSGAVSFVLRLLVPSVPSVPRLVPIGSKHLMAGTLYYLWIERGNSIAGIITRFLNLSISSTIKMVLSMLLKNK